MNIRYIPFEELEMPKYNGCVHYAYNSNIFGFEWYLKATSRSFGALVEDDYSSVMPLIIDDENPHKISLHPLVGRLGIYSVNNISPGRMNAFIDAIPEQFKSVDLLLNEEMKITTLSDYTVETYESGHLQLTPPDSSVGKSEISAYETLRRNYHPDIIEVLQRDFNAEGYTPMQLTIEEFVSHYVSLIKQPSVEHALQRVMYNAKHRGVGFPMVYQNSEGVPVIFAYFIYDQGKVFNLALASQNADEDLQIYALDSFLRSHAGRPLILDMNNIRPDFCTKFGAKLSPYHRIYRKTRFERFMGKLGM